VISEKLDEADFIDDMYILECSSPGLGREIKKERDYTRNLDALVEVHLYKGIDKEKTFVGILKSFDENNITIMIDDDKELTIERSNISLIKEYFEF